MRIFKEKCHGGWQYGEKMVVESSTGNEFVLTQPKILFSEDGYSIKRALCCHLVPVTEIPEKEFYVYEISYMPDGYSLVITIVDEDTAEKLIGSNLQAFLRGYGNNGGYISEFFKKERSDVR